MLSQREKGFILGAIHVALEGLKKELVTRDRVRQSYECTIIHHPRSPSNDTIAVAEVIENFKRTWKIKRNAPHDVVILVPWVYQNLALRIEERDEIEQDLWTD